MTEQKTTANPSTDELLSALVDGELTETEIQQLLDSASPELLERWSRYHLAQEAMNKGAQIQQPINVFANISAAIADEPVLGQSQVSIAEPKTHSLEESLSALVDGETSEFELRRILKTNDEAVFKKLGRFHLVSNVLRKEVSLAKHIDVSSAVSEAIMQDSEVSASPKTGLWANLGRFGIAASVAGALVVGVQFLSTSEPQNIADNNAPPVSGQPILGNENAVRVVGNEAVKATEQTEEELEQEKLKPQQ